MDSISVHMRGFRSRMESGGASGVDSPMLVLPATFVFYLFPGFLSFFFFSLTRMLIRIGLEANGLCVVLPCPVS